MEETQQPQENVRRKNSTIQHLHIILRRTLFALFLTLITVNSYPHDSLRVISVRNDSGYVSYELYVEIGGRVADTISVFAAAQQIDTLHYLVLSENVFFLMYETDASNRITHGRTIRMKIYEIINNQLVVKSEAVLQRGVVIELICKEFLLNKGNLEVHGGEKASVTIYNLYVGMDLQDLRTRIYSDFKGQKCH